MIGRKISHYKILAKLGEGGMGVVYRAHDLDLDRDVAIKFLPHFVSQTDTQGKRFIHEARAASALDHPNICTVYDIDETADGQTFIVMHFCGGKPLEELIAGDELPIDKVVDIAIKVASGLASAHGKGIVHRDIKPGNIIVSDDCGVKVIDFGLAKLTGKTAITRDGAAMGTVAYMAPEQVRGEEVDHRADIWSLGAVLYEMVTGMKPYSGDHEAAVIYQILNEEPAPVMSVRAETPEPLARIIHRALARDRADRFATMDDMGAALESIGSQAAAAAGPTAESCTALSDAREALLRQAWAEAFAAFEEADSQIDMAADDLDRWANTAFWMNRIDVAVTARERAHAKFVKADQPARAAREAIELAQDNYQKGSRTVCNGWVARAEKLLRNVPDAVENGYLARFRAKVAIEADQDFDTALEQASIALEMAEKHGNADLLALATQDRGRVLVLKNQVKEGMGLLDEAMAMAISGELSPVVIGMTYCNMITMCEKIADYRRASEWSDQAVRWCKPHSDSAFPGICCVHRAEVMNVRGDWISAESEAMKAVRVSEGYSAAIAAEAHYVIGEIKLRQGNYVEAEASFQEAHRQGRQPVPGMALLWLAQGRTDAARSLIDRALSGTEVDLNRIRILPAGVDVALAAGDVETARLRADELVTLAERLGSSVFSAHADYAVGNVALAEGDFEAALLSLSAARKSWKAVNMPYEEARTRIGMATAYWKEGEADLAKLEALAAITAFETLGASADLEHADALIRENA